MIGEQRLFHETSAPVDPHTGSPSEVLLDSLLKYLQETRSVERSRLLRIGNTCLRDLGAQAPDIAPADLINFAALNRTNGLVLEALEAADKSLVGHETSIEYDQTGVYRLCSSIGLLAKATRRRDVIPTYVRAQALHNLMGYDKHSQKSSRDFSPDVALMVALQGVTEGPGGITDPNYLKEVYTQYRSDLMRTEEINSAEDVMDPGVAVLLALEATRTRNLTNLKKNTLTRGTAVYPRLAI